MSITAALKDAIWGKFDPRKYDHTFTPDIRTLQQKAFQFLFVCCDMQKNKRSHHFLSPPASVNMLVGPAWTRQKFVLYRKNLGSESFPIPLPGESEQDYIHNRLGSSLSPVSAKVKGELYIVDTECITEHLDIYRQNGLEFQRKAVDIVYPFKTLEHQRDRDNGNRLLFLSGEQTYLFRAYMYVGIPKYWNEYLDAGVLFSPCTLKKSQKKWLPEYYQFE